MTDRQDRTGTADAEAFRELPAQIRLGDTSTTHDTSAADSFGSLGAISATSPQDVAVGPEGAGDGD